MSKTYSRKFWIIFWLISVIFLTGWFLYWEIKNRNVKMLDNVVEYLPFGEEKREEYKTLLSMADYILKKDDTEKTFLLLFQNNLELRPGGGYIGSFGIITFKNGEITKLQTHDVSNYDGRIPDTVEPPYPMKELLAIKSWKLRDSNYSPDFITNAKKAEEFYYMGQGEEKFDGIIGVNASVLTSFLQVTGPVEIPGYPGTYDSENAIIQLEGQVEKDFYAQGIERGDRKAVMKPLADEIVKRCFALDKMGKLKLAGVVMEDLENKDIQLYFKNPELEKSAQRASWDGTVDQAWQKDYLMMVDANLGAYKSDYYIKRSFDYQLDLSQETPKVTLKVTYNHTAKQKDFMTRDYISYLRVYVPDGSWLESSEGTGEMHFGQEAGKKYFGSIITVPLGQSRTITFSYNLPKGTIKAPYTLKLQKQSGVSSVPGDILLINPDGSKKSYSVNLQNTWVSSDN